jgi:hypothetical protein
MTAGPVYLWLPRLLPGVGACFNFVGASERLSHIGTARRKCTLGVRGLEWEAYVTPGFKAKPDAHRMYAQDQVVIHTVRM